MRLDQIYSAKIATRKKLAACAPLPVPLVASAAQLRFGVLYTISVTHWSNIFTSNMK